MEIRHARIEDLDAILEIYNDCVLHSTATFDTQPKTREAQEKGFLSHDAKHPILVAVENGECIAWASLSPWSDRPAYSGTAEVSLYVHKKHRAHGIGKQILAVLVQAGKDAGLHTLVSRIAEGNQACIHIHQHFGFVEIGVMKEAGHKFGRYIDVTLMQLLLKDRIG
ncbi:N-acetyltransferase [bacterium]|nr:N-acetyltransferase [bacterium]